MKFACGGCGSLGSEAAHTVCLCSDGRVFCWGDGLHGQVVPDCKGKYLPTAVDSQTCALAGVRVQAVAAGGAATFVVSDDGRLYSWGGGGSGALGLGSLGSRCRHALVPTQVSQIRLVKTEPVADPSGHV